MTETRSCPHVGRDDRNAPAPDLSDGPAYEWVTRRGERTLLLRDLGLARELLRRGDAVRQAGFQAERLLTIKNFRQPMLFQEGELHREMRRLSGRFFTPKAVQARYDDLITRLCDDLVGQLERNRGGRLDTVTFRLAMAVVSEVVGLTESDPRGMERRLDQFFGMDTEHGPWHHRRLYSLINLYALFHFHVRDVLPAVRARRVYPRDDVISNLIAQGIPNLHILSEAVTFGAAGMVTTREFLSMCVWQLCEHDDLRERYLAAERDERMRILDEIIRLDSVATHLWRRTTEPLTIESNGTRVDLDEGVLVDIALHHTNIDAACVDEQPLSLDPDRCPVRGVARSGLSFSAGPHQCPGEYLAMHETDVFLRRLFRNEVRITQGPSVSFDPIVQAYALSDFTLEVRPKA